MGFYLFRTPKPRQYDHVPIYYDEKKERLDELKKNADIAAGKASDEEYKPNFKGAFRRSWHKNPVELSESENKKSNLRLVAIVIVLLFVAWMILNFDGSIINAFYDK